MWTIATSNIMSYKECTFDVPINGLLLLSAVKTNNKKTKVAHAIKHGTE